MTNNRTSMMDHKSVNDFSPLASSEIENFVNKMNDLDQSLALIWRGKVGNQFLNNDHPLKAFDETDYYRGNTIS